jgi:predicted Zn-dependent protease with MMP-like domain
MAEGAHPRTFDEIVEWAYGTLPQKIKDLPDFPGIQVADEPPEGYLKTKNQRTELLGLHVGIPRTERQWNDVRPFSDLIFVFRGPILRCSKGDLRAEVKQVVWHEVAHWLGHNEEEVAELGLSSSIPITGGAWAESERRITASELNFEEKVQETTDQPRCPKCYAADVTCRELNKPLTTVASSLSDPIFVHAKICTCNSCSYEWDDEDNL